MVILKKNYHDNYINHLFDEGHIYLRAIYPRRNIFRFYAMHISRDLFSNLCLITTYGRIGTRGVTRKYCPHNLDDLNKIIKILLKKRLTAEGRLGCNYSVVN